VYLFSTDQAKTKLAIEYFIPNKVDAITVLFNKSNHYLYVYLRQLQSLNKNIFLKMVENMVIYDPFILSANEKNKQFSLTHDWLFGDYIAPLNDELIAIPNIVNCNFIIPYQQAWGNVSLGFTNTWSNNKLKVDKSPEDYEVLWEEFKKNGKDYYEIPSFYVRNVDFSMPSALTWDQRFLQDLGSQTKNEPVGNIILSLIGDLCKKQQVKVIGDCICFDRMGV
jgi:hypothetical protein